MWGAWQLAWQTLGLPGEYLGYVDLNLKILMPRARPAWLSLAQGRGSDSVLAAAVRSHSWPRRAVAEPLSNSTLPTTTVCKRCVRRRWVRRRAAPLLVLLAVTVWIGGGALLWRVALGTDSGVLSLVEEALGRESPQTHEDMATADEPEVAPILPGSSEWGWAQTIWDYHHMNHQLVKADGIMVLCSHDLRVADEATRLFKAGLGDWVIFSGGFGTGPHSGANLNGWTRPEAEIFAEAGAYCTAAH